MSQDRFLTSGALTYTYAANGELHTATSGPQTTTYTYDPLGHLLRVPGASPAQKLNMLSMGRTGEWERR